MDINTWDKLLGFTPKWRKCILRKGLLEKGLNNWKWDWKGKCFLNLSIQLLPSYCAGCTVHYIYVIFIYYLEYILDVLASNGNLSLLIYYDSKDFGILPNSAAIDPYALAMRRVSPTHVNVEGNCVSWPLIFFNISVFLLFNCFITSLFGICSSRCYM